MKTMNKMIMTLFVCGFFIGCGGEPLDLPQTNCQNNLTSSSSSVSAGSGGAGGSNGMAGAGGVSASSSTGCQPKNCDTLSVELSQMVDAGTIHDACGYLSDGCNGYVNCGACKSQTENCQGESPHLAGNGTTWGWSPLGGTPNLCGGGCVTVPIAFSSCPQDHPNRVECSDKANIAADAIPPEGWWDCYVDQISATQLGTEGIHAIRWCCK